MLPPTLFGQTLPQLTALAAREGMPSFTAKQIAHWLYHQGVDSVEGMTNVSLAHRLKLGELYSMGITPPTKVSQSADGTHKYLFPTSSGRAVEAAYIPEADRATLCVSSQAGCRMGCRFCASGQLGLQGNLTPGEIVNQLRSIPEWRQVSNIVFMGMGEPFDNLENVLVSLEILTSPWGMGMSPRRITISTVGVIPAMHEFVARSQCHLAVSLHSPFDDQRRELMPVQNAHPIAEVVSAIRGFKISGQRRVSFEYIVFDGMNDSPQHVKAIVRLLGGISCRVNLIRYHAVPGLPYRAPSQERMVEIRDALTSKGVFTTVRASRGQDIMAACGLLSTTL